MEIHSDKATAGVEIEVGGRCNAIQIVREVHQLNLQSASLLMHAANFRVLQISRLHPVTGMDSVQTNEKPYDIICMIKKAAPKLGE